MKKTLKSGKPWYGRRDALRIARETYQIDGRRVLIQTVDNTGYWAIEFLGPQSAALGCRHLRSDLCRRIETAYNVNSPGRKQKRKVRHG